MKSHYTHDIIVIGAGSGGLTCAIFMQRAGFKVLLIDKRNDSFGGDCLNYGCVPSKALLHVSKLIKSSNDASKFRNQSSGPVDIQKVMDYVTAKKDVIRKHENPEYLRRIGLDIEVGTAQFNGKQSVTVGDKSYSAKNIVIATGSRARKLSIEGIDNITIYDNETVFDMKKLPKNFVFIGGGPINIELGQAFARLGSKVTILQGSDRILEKEDLETSALMQSVLENENVRVICNAKVSKFTSSSVVFIESNEEHSVEAEAVFVGIGRIPNTDELELKRAGIQITDSSAIYTDKFMRTSNKHVYAVGDVAGQHMFTHAAEMQAIAVLRNMFSPIKIAYDSSGMNWTTFTDPEVSTFGRNKQELDKSGAKFKVVEVDISEDDRAITENSTKGFLRLFITKRGYILGGTLVSQRSGEIASELVSMMQYRVPLTAALKKTFAYPTGSRIIQSVARSYSANQYKSKYVKRLLRILY